MTMKNRDTSTVGVEALRSTTLRQLGLTRGRAIIRLIHRVVDESTLSDIRRKLDVEKRKQARLDAKADQHHTSSEGATHGLGATSTPAITPSAGGSAAGASSSSTPMDTGAGSYNTRIGASSRDSDVPPDEIVTSGYARLGYGQSRSDCTRSYDWATGPQDRPTRPPTQAWASERPAEHSRMSDVPRAGPSRDRDVIRQAAPPPVAPFKFPEATKGQTLYRNELQENRSEDYLPCDREALVYNLEEQRDDVAMETDDVTDDFFDVTQADLQVMMKDLKEKAKSVENQPLMTSSMRQAMLEERMSKYSHVVVRVQFPDRLVLQGIFKPRETVHSLHKFVREHLANKSEKFYLYTTPPRTVLSDHAQTLILANLAPAAVVHFGADQKRGEGSYLSSALLRELTTRRDADQVVTTRVIPPTSPSQSSSSVTMTSQQTAGATTESSQKRARSNFDETRSRESGGKKKELPKWFKPGLK